MRKTKKSKIVSTDYSTYVFLYACNDESWWKSVDMYSIFLRKIDDTSTALSNLITNLANNIFFTNNTAAIADLIGAYTKYDQTNPICKQITDIRVSN